MEAGKYANVVDCVLKLADVKENVRPAEEATGDPRMHAYAFCIAESDDHWIVGHEQLRRALTQNPD